MAEPGDVPGHLPFEFAVVAEPDFDARQWSAVVRGSEDLGYDMLLVTDHLQLRLAAVPALAAAAAMTSRIRLGAYVLNSDLRNPALLAADLATVHTLSGGRTVVGLGAGWMRADYEKAGVELGSGRSRVDRLREAVPRVREILHAAAALDGTPAPPLLLGGARRRMLELAGREADIVSVLPPRGPAGYETPLDDTVDAQLARVHAAAAGRSVLPRLNHLLWGCYVTDEPATVIEAVARQWDCPPHIVPRLVPYLIGTVDEIAEQVVERRRRWGFSVITVPAWAAETFAPVMRLLRA